MRFAIFIITALAVLCMAIGCTNDPAPTPKWNNGDMVRSVLSNQRGQVIRLRCFPQNKTCYYDVRFVGLSITTHTHNITTDGAVSTEPLTVVEYMREYELKND